MLNPVMTIQLCSGLIYIDTLLYVYFITQVIALSTFNDPVYTLSW